MEIKIQIDRLTLHGFNYHDHRRIATSFELELAGLITKNWARQNKLSDSQPQIFNEYSFKLPTDMNPKSIGAEIARSVYKELTI
ncbi:MAG: hypothetical protein WCF23_06545 [Candidatus Nitrosopolaris sp.]